MPKETRGRRRPRSSPLAGTVMLVKKPSPMRGVVFASRSRSAIMPPETKFFDVSLQQSIAVAADWTGTEVPATNYVQSDGTTVGAYTDSALIPSAVGSGFGQVQGNKYFLKHIRVKGVINSVKGSDQADVPEPATVRIVLVHDTQPNGAQAQGEEVFTDMGTAVQCNYSFLAMGAGFGGRFRILKDKTFMLNPAVVGTDGTSTLSVVRNGTQFHFAYCPKTPIQVVVKANSATPTVASLSNNNIFLLAHSSLGTQTLSAVSRAYYQD